ncbi:MAG: hypothetical protein RLZZ292_2961 [Bacteroidota bacterium]|jgi:uncharacterized protein YwqG
MKYFKVSSDRNNARPDGEYWIIRSERSLHSFQSEHFMGSIPRAEDIERLPIFVYSDYLLSDILAAPNFYDAYFISEKIKNLLDSLNLAEGQFYFFEKNNVEWRGQEHRYWWMQPLKPKFENAYFNLTLDLFFLPDGDLGNSLRCSENLKNAIENAGIKGWLFTEVDKSEFSRLPTVPKMAIKPTIFEVEFGDNRNAEWLQEQPRPKTVAEFSSAAEWHETLFSTQWLADNETLQADKATLLPLLKKITRQTLVMDHLQSPKEVEPIEKNPNKSRFFGKPYLPQNHVWPRSESGQPLTFIAQINLSELPQNEDLPTTGQLVFFFDVYGSTQGWPSQPDRNRVVYFEDSTDFVLTDFPTDLPLNQDFKTIDLSFQPYFDLPDNRWTELYEVQNLPEKEVFRSFLGEISSVDTLFASGPKLLGWAWAIQGDVGFEAEMEHTYKSDWSVFEANKVEIFQAARSWRLLFGFSADAVGLGDQLTDPRVYFMIKEEDLVARNFEKVVLVMQNT